MLRWKINAQRIHKYKFNEDYNENIAVWEIHYCTYYLDISFNDIQLSRTSLSRNATLYYRNVNGVS